MADNSVHVVANHSGVEVAAAKGKVPREHRASFLRNIINAQERVNTAVVGIDHYVWGLLCFLISVELVLAADDHKFAAVLA